MFETSTSRKSSVRRNVLRRRRGQGMTEYIIIVGLIAIVLVGAISKFKGALGGAFDAATGKVGSEVTDKVNGARSE